MEVPQLPPREFLAFPNESLQLQFDVNPDGTVKNPVIVRSDTPQYLDYFGPPTLAATQKWRFERVSAACRGTYVVTFKATD